MSDPLGPRPLGTTLWGDGYARGNWCAYIPALPWGDGALVASTTGWARCYTITGAIGGGLDDSLREGVR